MSTYAIGDLQGCHEQLLALVALIRANDPAAAFVFVGDIVNRGPASLATLREIRDLAHPTNMVLGNHDLNLLAVAQGIRPIGRSDTIAEILAAPDRDALLDWLRQQPLAMQCEDHLIVHAGVLPSWSMAQTLSLAHEVESALRGPAWCDFLAHMYGNTPARWDDGLQGYDRLRCIVNALTRMRYCLEDGSMCFSGKEEDAALGAVQIPWYALPQRQTQFDKIVFGHWSALGLTLQEHVMGIDSGCVWGGQLSAIRLSDHQLFQVNCPMFQQPG